MKQISNIEKILICTLLLTLLLLGVAILFTVNDCSLDYGFYTFLRIAVTVSFGWLAVVIASPYWRFTLGAGAVLFNPIIKIHLDQEVWLFFDIVAFILLIVAFVYYRKSLSKKAELK